MKYLIAFLFLPLVSQAQSIPGFSCMTNPVTSDVFLQLAKSQENKGKLELGIVHHYGVKGMPFHEGIITPSDFDYLKNKADVMMKLGSSILVTFDPADCEVTGKELLACHSNKKTKIGSLDVNSYRIVTRTKETKVYEFSFQENQMTFSFVFEGMTYDMPLSYASQDCKF